MIDTLDIYTKLKATGLTAKQAEAIAKVIFRVHSARSNGAVAEKETEARPDFSRNVK